ncbi:Coenzyme F420 hydrogenase/dehydrogenase, beta subunit C-terminal domain [Nocardioides xinjiangensis]|uniref:Coenzyme F420 hydrogenase/dehydrogenase, beta subunit C-terminal domain n=1 Tax=Nocardioides xinjiangensis TaxID=2817376 RepID=UPI001B315C20|nr:MULTISPECIES: Coenzyme F420 hydrogenase/dehydrogenase, beta subunit C-terminal domain [unclassified Nocardioides]
MSKHDLDSIEGIVDARLCTGCGACAYLHRDRLRMADVPGVGRRPLPIVGITTRTTGEGVDACPGRALSHPPGLLDDAPFRGEWGPILGLYECWSTDSDLRHRGSSGGVVSALAAHAVDAGFAVGALQVRASRTDPLRNETVLNRTCEDIVAAAGSRYAPASPCERLDLVEEAEGPCVVVGKPCDVAAARRAAAARPRLEERVAVTLGIFCAGTPSTEATVEAIERLGVDPAEVTRVDYRGEGWPGEFRVETTAGDRASMSYAEAWGGLTKKRQWRCLVCPDHTGEFADLSVGDPWYRPVRDGEAGRSLVVLRTERGRDLLESAFAHGALDGVELPLERLTESQPSLGATRGAVWGRRLAMLAMRMPAPRYRGMPAFRLWWRLPARAKAGSTLGTARRIVVRDLRRPELESSEVG